MARPVAGHARSGNAIRRERLNQEAKDLFVSYQSEKKSLDDIESECREKIANTGPTTNAAFIAKAIIRLVKEKLNEEAKHIFDAYQLEHKSLDEIEAECRETIAIKGPKTNAVITAKAIVRLVEEERRVIETQRKSLEKQRRLVEEERRLAEEERRATEHLLEQKVADRIQYGIMMGESEEEARARAQSMADATVSFNALRKYEKEHGIDMAELNKERNKEKKRKRKAEEKDEQETEAEADADTDVGSNDDAENESKHRPPKRVRFQSVDSRPEV